jgi:hypothetical protein
MALPAGIEIPHMKHPVTRGQYVEQATVEHVESRATGLLVCPIGFRLDRPSFGIPWPHMQSLPLDPQPIINALKEAGIDGVDPVQILTNIGTGDGQIELYVETPTDVSN